MAGLLDGWSRTPEQEAAFDAYEKYMEELYGPIPEWALNQAEAEFEVILADASIES